MADSPGGAPAAPDGFENALDAMQDGLTGYDWSRMKAWEREATIAAARAAAHAASECEMAPEPEPDGPTTNAEMAVRILRTFLTPMGINSSTLTGMALDYLGKSASVGAAPGRVPAPEPELVMTEFGPMPAVVDMSGTAQRVSGGAPPAARPAEPPPASSQTGESTR